MSLAKTVAITGALLAGAMYSPKDVSAYVPDKPRPPIVVSDPYIDKTTFASGLRAIDSLAHDPSSLNLAVQMRLQIQNYAEYRKNRKEDLELWGEFRRELVVNRPLIDVDLRSRFSNLDKPNTGRKLIVDKNLYDRGDYAFPGEVDYSSGSRMDKEGRDKPPMQEIREVYDDDSHKQTLRYWEEEIKREKDEIKNSELDSKDIAGIAACALVLFGLAAYRVSRRNF